MSQKLKPLSLNYYIFITLIIWSVIIAASVLWNMYQHEEEMELIVQEVGRSTIERDKLFRLWNVEHGPIYAPVSEKNTPNPYLSTAITPQRDLTISPDLTLTMINPAYMTRQIYELAKEKNTISGHLTSLSPVNPKNKPLAWEIKALNTIKKGAKEYTEIIKSNENTVLHMLLPLRVEKSCLKCHAVDGYKEGDLRGGISVTQSLNSIHKEYYEEHLSHWVGHLIIWLIGVIGILLGFSILKQKENARLKAEEQIRYMAHFDKLTGLVNRNLLHDRFTQALALAKRKKNKIALLYIDLDRFKPINDNFGHDTGDIILHEVAALLMSEVRKSDTVARIGGDEFVIVLQDINKKEEAGTIAHKVLTSIRNPFIIDGREHSVGSSIGISFFPDDGDNMDILLKKADKAMYDVKDRGGDSFKYYN